MARRPRPEPAESAGQMPADLPTLQGNLDQVTQDGWVAGWCWYPDRPDEPVSLAVMVDDVVIGRTDAVMFREDLRRAGVGSGAHGFSYALPWAVLAAKGVLKISLQELDRAGTPTGRLLGAPMMARLGPMAQAEERIAQLEDQLRGLRAQVAELTRDVRDRPAERAARELFASVATFFTDLARDDPAPTGSPWLDEAMQRLPRLTLAVPEAPVATILIPGIARAAVIHGCLVALREGGIDQVAELVMVDDGGQGADVAVLPAVVRNLRYMRARPGQEIAAAMTEALEDGANHVVFLAPWVRVAPGWLDELLATFAREPDAAAVGSRLIRADGLLQPVGLVLHPSGNLTDPGGLAQAFDARFGFRRSVDALAALSVAIRRDRLDAAGGFPTGFGESGAAALGRAMSDLCRCFRAGGHSAVVQPMSVASLVADAALDGTDTAPDLSRQDAETARLRQRWFGSPGTTVPAAPPVSAAILGHALVVDVGIPRPDRDAGSVAALRQMLILGELGWRVIFAAAVEPPDPAAAAALERLGIEVARPEWQGSVTQILEQRGAQLGLVQLYRHGTAALLIERVRTLVPQAKIVFSPADLHHLREARGAALAGTGLSTNAVETLRTAELACVREADATIVVSDHEYDLLAEAVGPDRLHLLRWIAEPVVPAFGFAERAGLCFVGNFGHPPNRDGLLWFVREVLPELRLIVPGARLHVAGADMPEEIAALASSAVTIHGWVADLPAFLGRMRLSVAPLRYGAGFKGKVAESLAHGLPVAGTRIAIEGTGLSPGDGVVIADGAAEMARTIARIHEDAGLWGTLSRRGLERVGTLYSVAAARSVYRDMLAELGLGAAPELTSPP